MSVVTIAVTIVGLWFASREYLAYKEERKAERLEALAAEWESTTMMFYRAGAAKAYPKGSPHLLKVFTFFERLARAKQQGIISEDDLHYYFGEAMLTYWCGWEPWVRQKRADGGEDQQSGQLWRGFQEAVADVKRDKNMQCLTAAEVKNVLWFEQDGYQQLVLAAPQPGMQAATPQAAAEKPKPAK